MSNGMFPWISEYFSAKKSSGHSVFTTRQVRDLTVIELNDDFYFVVAVDSDGGIGPKPNDRVVVSGEVAGRFATRVPLMEILACGAVPVAAFDALAVEMEPLGKEIIQGVRNELLSIGLPDTFPLSGSTEDNVPTTQTGMGVVILGIVGKKDFRPGSSLADDELFVIGLPKSGPEDKVTLDDREIADSASISRLIHAEGIHDVLPVGSKGILFEARELARTAGCTFIPHDGCSIDVMKSAGPSTCFIVSAEKGMQKAIARAADKPVNVIGKLTA